MFRNITHVPYIFVVARVSENCKLSQETFIVDITVIVCRHVFEISRFTVAHFLVINITIVVCMQFTSFEKSLSFFVAEQLIAFAFARITINV